MGRNDRARRKAAIAALSDEAKASMRLRANGELYLRVTAVIQQSRRLREDGQPGAEYMADMWLFAHALSATLKFGEFCWELSEGVEADGLRTAIEAFKDEVPDAVLVRDVLEHFDDYMLKVGRKQRLLSSATFFYERGEAVRVHVGEAVIDVDAAERAAIALATAIVAGGGTAGER